MLPLNHLLFREPGHGLATLLPSYCPSSIWELIEQILGSIKSACVCYLVEDNIKWHIWLAQGCCWRRESFQLTGEVSKQNWTYHSQRHPEVHKASLKCSSAKLKGTPVTQFPMKTSHIHLKLYNVIPWLYFRSWQMVPGLWLKLSGCTLGNSG